MKSLRTTASLALLLVGGGCAARPPAGDAWIPRAERPLFVAVVTHDAQPVVDWYREVFGLETASDRTSDDDRFRIVNLRNDWLFVEIVRNRSAPIRMSPCSRREKGTDLGSVPF